MGVELKTIPTLCTHRGYAFAYRDDHTRMEPVCYRTEYDANGAELGKCGHIEMTVVSEPEDYE